MGEADIQGALDAYRRGDARTAESVCRTMLARSPDHRDALDLLGLIAFAGGRLDDAIAAFEASARQPPPRAVAWARLGAAQGALGRPLAALTSFDQALSLDGRDPGVWINRGLALAALGRGEEAVASHDRAIALDPNLAEAFAGRGAALASLGRPEDALASLDRALNLKPGLAEAHNDRGVVLARLGRATEAVEAHARAAALRPDHGVYQVHHGLALARLKQGEAALACYDRALALAPGNAEAWSARGKALADLQRLDEALESYDRALTLQPDHPEARSGRGLVRLLQGRLVEGFLDYEHRWRSRDGPTPRFTEHAAWTGAQDLAGRTLLLHAEQGFGDTIQFVRYAELARRRGAEVLIEVPPPLRRLMAALDPPARVFARGEPLPPFDLHCPLLSLPAAFGTDLAAIPWSGPYLRADPAEIDLWRRRLGPARGPRIGLAWSGNPTHNNDLNRSLAAEALDRLAGPGRQFICLQRDVRAQDEAWLAEGALKPFRGDLVDFATTAALAQTCDLVISVDTAIAHLAGALGKPVWILLPWTPDWRWGLQGEDSPWYPSARLVRQPHRGDWGSVILDVAERLSRRFPVA